MITVDIKSLLNRLNSYCTQCLESAIGLSVSRTHYEVSAEHFFLKLTEDSTTDISLTLNHFSINPKDLTKVIDNSLEDFKTGNTSKPVFSPLLIQWIEEAWLAVSINLNEDKIRSGALLLAFLSKYSMFAEGNYSEVFFSLSKEEYLGAFHKIVSSSTETVKYQSATKEAPAVKDGKRDAISRFCNDFTEKARAGEIDPVFGRDAEIRQIIDILARRRKNNPIVVGEAGVGKTAVVEGLALQVVEDDVPDLLKNVSIIGLDMGLLQAGAGMKGEFENRLKSVINEVKASETPIILFIDEAHMLVGSGGASGTGDAANLLKPALARGELRTIAATTWSEYKKFFEKDAALARRFQLIKLDEPSKETATLILRGLKEKYEDAHNVIIRDDAVISCVELSSRYISGRYLPDKCVDLLDTSAARVKVLLSAKPDILEDKIRTIKALIREKEAIERDQLHGLPIDESYLSTLIKEIEQSENDSKNLEKHWKDEKQLAENMIELREKIAENPDPEEIKTISIQIEKAAEKLKRIQGDAPLLKVEVDPDVVAKVVSDWTGIPLGKVMRDQALNILNMESVLKNRIKGQDDALKIISESIKAAKAEIKDPNQPLAVFLLAGPSGVGKTETGLAIAELLFGGENFVVTINMSEFQEKHTVSRLIGSPPGYVGYGEGGILTEAVRQRPYSVVLVDEVEKGHLEVLNLFYQVFDKGTLSDGEGREIDFKNTVIILTSNLSSDVITQMSAGEEKIPFDTICSAVRPILTNHFKPALLARTTVIPYLSLSPDILKHIVELKLDKLVKRLDETHKIKLTYAPEVVAQIADRCRDIETGARNIDYIVRGNILPTLSQKILAQMSEGEMPDNATLTLKEDGTFHIEFHSSC